MVFNCTYCGKPIHCVGATHEGDIIHHTCKEKKQKEEDSKKESSED